MENIKEAATCAACGERRGTIETLIGRICHECESGPAHRAEPVEYPSDGGQAEILHGPLDL